MTDTGIDHFVLMDSNSLVTERLLISAIGSALLYSVAQSRSRIIVPEVVERETTAVLVAMASNAADAMQKGSQLIGQLTGHKQVIMVPNENAVQDAIAERWQSLSGIIDRVPFSFEQAQAALTRIISGLPPCGPNNEQFRDCCIWHAAVEKAAIAPVYLITSDKAFYQGGTYTNGMAHQLAQEISNAGRKVVLRPSIASYLSETAGAATKIDEDIIRRAIISAIQSEANRIAHQEANGDDEVYDVEIQGITITGYATPKESVVAVSFDARFRLTGITEHRELKMSLGGSCSWNPSTGMISDVAIVDWSKSVAHGRDGLWSTHKHSQEFSKFFKDGNFRILKS